MKGHKTMNKQEHKEPEFRTEARCQDDANPPGIIPDPQQSKMNTTPRKLNKG